MILVINCLAINYTKIKPFLRAGILVNTLA